MPLPAVTFKRLPSCCNHGDLTVPEIARAMRCSQGTVKSTLHAALGRLRVDLGDRDLEGVRDES